ncbi:MAG: hypothetical protein AAGG11_12785 [Pseudomonadota bacterium]
MTEAATSTASEWYIITDDAALTLRITPGLTLGEQAHGELALSHQDTATQWVRFDPAVDGSLSLKSIDDAASLKLGAMPVLGKVEITAGMLIQLPNNRLLISNHFRGQEPAGTPLTIQHSKAYQGPPLLTTGVNLGVASPSVNALAARPPQGPNRAPLRNRANPDATVAAETRSERPLENALSAHRDAVGSLLNTQINHTEEALVPVAAEAPFEDEELKTLLEQPIDLRETSTVAIPTLPTATAPRTPTALIPGQPKKRNLLYISTLGGIVLFGLLSALLAAFLNQPDERRDGELPPLTGDSLVLLPAPAETTAEPQVQRPTDALLRSVDNVIAEGDASDISIWDFAIRTYEFVLAQEPDNAAARLRLQEAQQTLAALQAGDAPATAEPPVLAPEGSVVAAIAEAADEATDAAAPAALTADQTTLLDLAEQRLEFGQAISPSSAAAVPLILSVLRDRPTEPRAITLLNRSADQLLREAEAAWSSNNQYLARNILEEVFAFHPRHANSNLRWTEWTGLPPRVPPALSPAVD